MINAIGIGFDIRNFDCDSDPDSDSDSNGQYRLDEGPGDCPGCFKGEFQPPVPGRFTESGQLPVRLCQNR